MRKGAEFFSRRIPFVSWGRILILYAETASMQIRDINLYTVWKDILAPPLEQWFSNILTKLPLLDILKNLIINIPRHK